MYVGLSGPTLIHDTPQPTRTNMNIETLLQPDGSLMLDVTKYEIRCKTQFNSHNSAAAVSILPVTRSTVETRSSGTLPALYWIIGECVEFCQKSHSTLSGQSCMLCEEQIRILVVIMWCHREGWGAAFIWQSAEVRLSTASEMCRKTEKCPTRLSRDDEW